MGERGGKKKAESIVIVIPPHDSVFTSQDVNIQVKINPGEALPRFRIERVLDTCAATHLRYVRE